MTGRGHTLTSGSVAKVQEGVTPSLQFLVVGGDLHTLSGLRKAEGGDVRVRQREKTEAVSLKPLGDTELFLGGMS